MDSWWYGRICGIAEGARITEAMGVAGVALVWDDGRHDWMGSSGGMAVSDVAEPGRFCVTFGISDEVRGGLRISESEIIV